MRELQFRGKPLDYDPMTMPEWMTAETIAQEDIEKAAEAFATPPIGNGGMFTREQVKELLVRFAQLLLSKQEKDTEDTVIQGWVCRDEDNTLILFYGSDKPTKEDNDDYWSVAFGNTLEYLSQEMFPDVKWEDVEPTKVELIIKRKKKDNV